MNEVWKDIAGYEGLYQVSNLGRVKSFQKQKAGVILSVKNSKGWYLSFRAANNKSYQTLRIHQLVAEYFLKKVKGKTEVNHKDLNKQNNCVKNLEWVTPSENMKHVSVLNPLFLKNMKHKNQFVKPKRIQQIDLDGNFIAEYANGSIASKFTGICQRNILQVANREEFSKGKIRKTAGGFIWQYKA